MTLVRPYRPEDASAARAVFWDAVHIGATALYSAEERDHWASDPAPPPGWGDWLAEHLTFVACEGPRLTGFFMLERSGYLNMAYVAPDRMGKGTADALYAATLDAARDLGLTGLTVLASRYAQGFFRRHGWRMAPEVTGLRGMDPRQGPADNPLNRPMALDALPPAG